MSGISPIDLLDEAVRPALGALGDRWAGRSAEQLLMGIAAVESGLHKLRQYGGGQAIGFWQMEPRTFRDILKRLDREQYADLRLSLVCLATVQEPEPGEMAWNLRFAAGMARMKLRDAKPRLPEPWDIAGFEDYHKRFYNSSLGATRPGEFTRAWQELIAPSAERMWPS